MCFPSIAPIQFGKFHLDWNPFPIALKYSLFNTGNTLFFRAELIAEVVSKTILWTEIAEHLYANDKLWCDSPVARSLYRQLIKTLVKTFRNIYSFAYLNFKLNLVSALIGCLIRTCFVIAGPTSASYSSNCL